MMSVSEKGRSDVRPSKLSPGVKTNKKFNGNAFFKPLSGNKPGIKTLHNLHNPPLFLRNQTPQDWISALPSEKSATVSPLPDSRCRWMTSCLTAGSMWSRENTSVTPGPSPTSPVCSLSLSFSSQLKLMHFRENAVTPHYSVWLQN